MKDRRALQPGPAALELRRLRKKAGIKYREMARLLKMDFSKYRHYEERLKDDHLPSDIYFNIRPILMARGITLEELRILLHVAMRAELKGVHDELKDVGARLEGIERLIRGDRDISHE